MIELVVWSCGAALVALLVGASRLCLRSLWELIAALGLFIVAYGLAADAVDRAAEAAIIQLGGGPGTLPRATVTLASASLSVVVIAAACVAAVFVVGRVLGVGTRSGEAA